MRKASGGAFFSGFGKIGEKVQIKGTCRKDDRFGKVIYAIDIIILQTCPCWNKYVCLLNRILHDLPK